MSLTRSLAQFVTDLRLDSIPSEVIEKARACTLNGFGIALGSHQTPFFSVASRAALQIDGEHENGATLLTDGRKTTAAGAAFANAALFHGRAQEDTCGVAHFGTILLPLLTALIETGNGVIEDFLPALIAGYEIGGLLESSFSSITTSHGLRASPLYGSISAAAAISKLMHLNEAQTAASLANAASFTGGTLQSFADGTDEWRYQVGIAAKNGLTATLLAANGSVSSPNAFDGIRGFVYAYVRTTCDENLINSQLGTNWSTTRVTFKPYPVCALNQTPVRAALKLRELLKHRLHPSIRIRARLNPTVVAYAGMNSIGPFFSLSGTLMSTQFCIATTLLNGAPTVARMAAFDDPKTNDLMAKISLIADPSIGLLSCVLEADVQAPRAHLHVELNADHSDYSYSTQQVSELIRRIGEETQVPKEAYDYLEKFVSDLPHADLTDVVRAFKTVQKNH